MARITLKITKPPAADAAPKVQSSRAKRAQLQSQRHKPRTPAAAVVETTSAATTEVADRRTTGGTDRGKTGGADRGRTTGTDRGKTSGADRPRRPFDARARSPAGAAPANARAEERPRTDRGKRRATMPTSAPTASAVPRAVPATPSARPPRHANPDDPRLSKRMSEMGLCSRREADEWIENGWVSVDGKVVNTIGVRVSPFARIEIAKAAAQHQSELVTIILNKPLGYVSGQAEDGHTPASVLLKPENRWPDDPSRTPFKITHLRGLAPAGRLDIDSTGLIVFTQDGRVAKRLIGSHSDVEKEYLVRVEGKLDDAGMKLLQHGLELDGVKLRPARVSWQNDDQLRFVLREGRKRQIRRMCELVGLVVTGLKRVRTGSVSLGPLPPGQWRYLRADERF